MPNNGDGTLKPCYLQYKGVGHYIVYNQPEGTEFAPEPVRLVAALEVSVDGGTVSAASICDCGCST